MPESKILLSIFQRPNINGHGIQDEKRKKCSILWERIESIVCIVLVLRPLMQFAEPRGLHKMWIWMGRNVFQSEYLPDGKE